MNETGRFTIGILIALLLSLCIGVPVTIYKAKRYIKEGKSIKNLDRNIFMAICLPLLAIPILLSNMFWLWKIGAIVLMALGGVSYGIGVDAAQKGLRELLGLTPIDENTGMVLKEKDDKDKDKKEN